MKRNPLRMAAACMLAIGVRILAFAMSGNNAANRDFVCYWAAGHQLANHGNPYYGQAILRLERQAGFADNRPFMRNADRRLSWHGRWVLSAHGRAR